MKLRLEIDGSIPVRGKDVLDLMEKSEKRARVPAINIYHYDVMQLTQDVIDFFVQEPVEFLLLMQEVTIRKRPLIKR